MLYKRANSKFYYVKIKHRGRTIQRSTHTAVKREAERYQEWLRKELQASRSNSGHTFNEAALRWLEERSWKRSISTDTIILEWFARHLAGVYLSDITREKIEELRLLKKAESSESTTNRYFQVLRALLKEARDNWQWIEKIPKVPMYKKEPRSPRFLTWDQFICLTNQLPSHLASPAWFAVSTGLRTRAIQELRWEWISRDGVRLPPEIIKNKEWLAIPLSMTAWYVLAEIQNHTRTGSSSIVFVSDAGKPWTGKFTTRAWKKAAKRAGIPNVTFHDLRHTFASWALQGAGIFDKPIPPEIVMELGGWKDRDAFKIYGHHSTKSLERLAGYL